MPLAIPPATRNRLLAILLLAFCAVAVAFPRPWHHSVRAAAQAAAQPPQTFLAAIHNPLRNTFRRLADLRTSAEEVERLRDENRTLREALARLADQTHRTELRIRNFQKLKGLQLGSSQASGDFRDHTRQHPLRIIPASVIAVDVSPWRHSVVVNRGASHGIDIGTPALSGHSIVGRVVAIRAAAATVRLITDSRSRIAARLVGTGNVGLLAGATEQHAHITLKWIHLHPVEEDDRVVTSGLDPAIPPGLVAGQVVRASQTRKPLFYDIEVRPLIDLHRLTEVLLLVRDHDEASDLLEQEEQAEPM